MAKGSRPPPLPTPCTFAIAIVLVLVFENPRIFANSVGNVWRSTRTRMRLKSLLNEMQFCPGDAVNRIGDVGSASPAHVFQLIVSVERLLLPSVVAWETAPAVLPVARFCAPPTAAESVALCILRRCA